MAFDVSYIFHAFDKFSAPVKKMWESVENLDRKIENATSRIKNMGQSIRKVGTEMSLYVSAPIVLFGADSFKEFDKAQNALAQVNLLLKNTKMAAGFTQQQLLSMDKALSEKSLYDRTAILSGVTKTLLQFQHIHGQTFKRAQKDVVDFAAFSKLPLAQAAKMLGVALEDPEQGLLRFKRYGVVFTEQQVKVMKQLENTGQAAKAQDYILRRLEQVYSRSAALAMVTGAGPIKEINKRLTEIKETVGANLAVALLPLVKILDHLLQKFQALSPHAKSMIIYTLGIIAVIGPLIAYIGILLLSLSAIGGVLVVLASPITGIIAGIGLMGYAFYALYEKCLPFKHLVEYFLGSFKSLGSDIASVWHALTGSGSAMTVNHTMSSTSSLPPAQFLGNMGNNQSSAHITLNVNDPTNTIKSIHTQRTGNANVNVGKNMAMAG